MIGNGSFGKVILGMNNETGQLMAVKQIKIENSRDIKVTNDVNIDLAITK